MSQHVSVTPTQEVDPRKQTLDFVEVKEEEEEEKEKVGGEWWEKESEPVDWPEMRKGWSQRSPQTLLDFLARVELADGGTALLHPVNITCYQHIS